MCIIKDEMIDCLSLNNVFANIIVTGGLHGR